MPLQPQAHGPVDPSPPTMRFIQRSPWRKAEAAWRCSLCRYGCFRRTTGLFGSLFASPSARLAGAGGRGAPHTESWPTSALQKRSSGPTLPGKRIFFRARRTLMAQELPSGKGPPDFGLSSRQRLKEKNREGPLSLRGREEPEEEEEEGEGRVFSERPNISQPYCLLGNLEHFTHNALP